jgi:hypothetical protein
LKIEYGAIVHSAVEESQPPKLLIQGDVTHE